MKTRWQRDATIIRSLHTKLIIYRGKKSGRTVRISENKVPGKSEARPFPTAEVIELRRLADEYKVIRERRDSFRSSFRNRDSYSSYLLVQYLFILTWNPSSVHFVFFASNYSIDSIVRIVEFIIHQHWYIGKRQTTNHRNSACFVLFPLVLRNVIYINESPAVANLLV